MQTKVQKIGKILNWLAGKLSKVATQCETSGKSLESAKGLGDVIATGTQATRLDRFAEWLATDVLGREGCGCPARRNRFNTLWPFSKPKLVIAIPEYNDRGGLWAMFQHLYWEIKQYGLEDHVEVMVVTQTPIIQAPERRIQDFGTPQQKELDPVPTTIIAGKEPLENLCKTMSARGGIKFHYREFTQVIGTGPAKTACINYARQLGAEWVWVCDSHLHFAPGSVHRFYKWVCKTKNRNSKHLYHCPLLYDDFKGAFTHFETRKSNKLALIGGDNLWGQFRSEAKLFDPDAEPMEISAQGGFWFATRTDVPFGHPLFKGFGDPETIIHEQRRALGQKVYCLPARIVSCVHRFLSISHRDYHSPQSDALRNHWIGVQSLRVHLMKEAVAAGFSEPAEWITAAWLDAFPHKKDMILQTVARAAEEYFQWEEQQRQAMANAMANKNKPAVATETPKIQSTPSDVFTDIFEKTKWGSGETVSGPGSTLDATETIRKEIPALMQRLNLTHLLDVPCGDHNWMAETLKANEWIKYIGCDIVSGLIQRNSERFPSRDFRVVDLISGDIPKSELVLVRDCLVHLPHSLVVKAIDNIRKSGSVYLLATTFPGRQNRDIQMGHWHPMDLSDKIFGLGRPIELINENCKEGDGQFKDKSLGLWKLRE